MLIPLQHLVDRLRHPRSRADELALLRRRLVALASDAASPEEHEAAETLRQLREDLSRVLEGVTSCSGCARGHAVPAGRWDGGFCCSGKTETIFTDDELAALSLAGTTPHRLTPPTSDVAGCAFRGPSGCSLAPSDRPTLCVRYLCFELERELESRGRLRELRRLADQLARTFRRFVLLRRARTSQP